MKIYSKNYIIKPLKQLAKEKNKIDDRKLAEKMINPYYFIDRSLKLGFKITLENHQINHANSKLTITPIYRDFGNEVCYFNKTIKESTVIYFRLINQ